MALDESQNPNDELVEAYGIKMIADQNAAKALDGAVLDFIESEMGSGFQIKSPRQTDCSSGCNSCG
jgi:Fe-S cluster assembly iron-binding protein IscA